MDTSARIHETSAVGLLRRALNLATAVVSGGVLALCVVVAVMDLSYHGDDWDGLGALIAAVFGVPALVALVLTTLSLRLQRRHPTASRVLSGVAALGMLALAVALLRDSGWAVPLLLAGCLLLVTAVVPGDRPGAVEHSTRDD
jgi:peptidoglycan/LPS O-acetylase OafA/YrhL